MLYFVGDIIIEFEAKPLKYNENDTKLAHATFLTKGIRLRNGVYSMIVVVANCISIFNFTGKHFRVSNSVINNKADTVIIALFRDISPVMSGRAGLFILSISKSYKSFNIILDIIIKFVVTVLVTNSGARINLCKLEFVMKPPVKHNTHVGRILFARNNLK
jgi:hypothetical protein